MKENDGQVMLFKKIIDKIRDNSHDGFELFHKTYGNLIASIAKTIKNSDYFVKEVESDVILKIWEAIRKNLEIKNPGGWVYVVAKNCAIDLIKEEKHLPLNEAITAEAVDDFSEIIENIAFSYYIKPLSKKEQQVFQLKYVQKYTYKEIAEELKMPLTTISSIHDRAKIKIEKWLEQQERKAKK